MPSMDSNIKAKWFHAKASRSHIEELVHKAGSDGSFAVRASDSMPGGYTISLLCGGRVYTYRIIPTEGKYAIETNYGVQRRKFSSVDEMINEYKNPGNGLACCLTNPVGKSNSFLQRIKPDLPARPAPARTPSALTLPLPPIPKSPPNVPVPTAPPPNMIASSPQPQPTIPVMRANSDDAISSSGFNPAGILAAVQSSGTTPALPPRPTVPAADHVQNAGGPPAAPAEPEKTEDSKTCIICLDANINAFFQPCGHLSCCMDCAKKIKDCPLCRKKISKVHKAYVP